MNTKSIVKKSFFRASMVTFILVLTLFRFFSSFELAKGLNPTNDKVKVISCDLKADDPYTDVPLYSKPNDKISSKYKESTIGNNLSVNSNFSQYDDTGRLVNYEDNASNDTDKKTVVKSENDSPYLDLQKTTTSDIRSSWIPDFINIENKPYFYSFSYKSSVEAEITIELKDNAGNLKYQGPYRLQPSQTWGLVENHFTNYGGTYSQARIMVSIKNKGFVAITQPQVFELGYTNLGTSMISVVFDDGRDSVYTNALPLLEKYNVSTTQFIVPGLSQNKEPGYMNFDQIKELSQKGNEIGSHSLNHCEQTKLSDDDLAKDFKSSQEIFKSNNIKPSGGFAYPFGIYNTKTQDFKKKEFKYIRTSDEGFNDFYYDIGNLHVKSVTNKTTTKDIETWVKYAKENNLWLILLYHQIGEAGEYNTSINEFENHLKVIKNSKVKTTTIEQALDNISD